jgi:hypothetical protein
MDVSGTGRLLLDKVLRSAVGCSFLSVYLDAKRVELLSGYLSWMDDLGYLAMGCVVEE